VADARPDSDVDDLATARALIATLRHELTTVQRENASLRHQLDVLCQRLFGKKSERVDPRQFQLALEQLANEPGPVMCENLGRVRISGNGGWTLTATSSPPESQPTVTAQDFQSRTG
jgi:cell division septum initiation protein DivIVA